MVQHFFASVGLTGEVQRYFFLKQSIKGQHFKNGERDKPSLKLVSRLSTVGARIPNEFSIRMVQSRLV